VTFEAHYAHLFSRVNKLFNFAIIDERIDYLLHILCREFPSVVMRRNTVKEMAEEQVHAQDMSMRTYSREARSNKRIGH
jgi:hypothetical protein